MKNAKVLNLIVLGLVLVIPFTGCRKKTTTLTPLPPPAKVGPPPTPGPGPMLPGETGKVEKTDVGWQQAARDQFAGWPENREAFKAQTVHFDFDSSVVKSGEKPKVDAVAAHLKSSPTHAVKIEGHCDERGTEEYNRALGERRALALREELIAVGVAPERVVTISYGEDRPADPGHDEAAWKKNRRGEFILLTPP